MRRVSARRRRILAIDPTHRGFGYVVFDGADRLFDWGLCHVTSRQASDSLGRVRSLILRLTPDLLVIEDVSHGDCRRGERARILLGGVATTAVALEVDTRRVAASAVRARYSAAGFRNKEAVAQALAERFPELEPLLPPPRKPWKSEDERMAVFDALSFVVALPRLQGDIMLSGKNCQDQ